VPVVPKIVRQVGLWSMQTPDDKTAARANSDAKHGHARFMGREVQDIRAQGAREMIRTMIVCALLAGCNPSPQPLDDTDSPDGRRSNLTMRIDHGTGCQYLSVYQAGLIPRYGPDGRHMGCRGLR